MDVVVCDAVEATQRYIRNTAVLETIITDKNGGQVRIVDFAPRTPRFGRSFRPPMLIRRIEPLTKRVRLKVRIRPHFNYGATKPTISVGSNHVRYTGGQTTLRVTADMAIAYILEEAEFALDKPVNLFIGPDKSVPEAPDSLAQSFLAATIEDWQSWVRGLSIPFEWQNEVIRSAITLKLCSCEDTGAIVAALTTSVPEAPRHSAQLGLSLLLAARCVLHRRRAEPAWRDADNGKFHPLHHRCSFARGRCRHCAALSDLARDEFRRAARVGALWLSGHGAGAHRQCRRIANPERRLWLDHSDIRADILGCATGL